MSILDVFSMQGSLFIMILTGLVLKKLGILDQNGKKVLTDLCIDIVIPCNIIKSFMVSLQAEVLKSCALVLLLGFILQILCVILNRFCFNRFPEKRKKVLQYCTIVPMSGFLGNPVAEGLYGDMGLLYTSMFLIPMRVVMWSAGTSYFVSGNTDKRKVIKNVLTHPCLVGVYIGLVLMLTQFTPPAMVTSAVKSIGGCNSALTMFIIGMILADVPVSTIVNPTTLGYSVFRLGILPAIAFLFCLSFGMTGAAKGVVVLMTGMPAGATAAIFAARYDSDALFATRLVVLTTLISMLTLPAWSLIL